jgi:formylglycine-generating enzyme required for sulfatase activity
MSRLDLLPALLLTLVLTHQLAANNIQVTSPSLTGNNLSTGTCFVQFNISWENSWRLNGEVNWDAAWVFVKFRTPQGVWQHAQLDNSGHVLPVGTQLEPGLLSPGIAHDPSTNPVVGVFIRRSTDGSGTFSANGAQLRWNYFAQGVGFNAIAEVRVFAVEMVYVNQGAFAAGEFGTDPFMLTTINTAMATAPPMGAGSLGGQAGGYPTGQIAPTHPSWPNGFDSFYCMKYEVTQQGYVDFLNTLAQSQQSGRTESNPQSPQGTAALTSANENRNGIDIQNPAVFIPSTPAIYACNLNGNGVFGENSDGLDIACNFLSWGDLSAYLDWLCFRPMSELEYEKACKGPSAGGFAWGTNSHAFSSSQNGYFLSNSGYATEAIATNYSNIFGNANVSFWFTPNNTMGPMRVGIFSANPNSSGRITAGASYYGIMEMTGNVSERAVGIGSLAGRSFIGNHGNGTLTYNGDADVPSWPSASTAEGAGMRGGGWSEFPMHVSDRSQASSILVTRAGHVGGRGVRTAP